MFWGRRGDGSGAKHLSVRKYLAFACMRLFAGCTCSGMPAVYRDRGRMKNTEREGSSFKDSAISLVFCERSHSAGFSPGTSDVRQAIIQDI